MHFIIRVYETNIQTSFLQSLLKYNMVTYAFRSYTRRTTLLENISYVLPKNVPIYADIPWNMDAYIHYAVERKRLQLAIY